jgi:hypothetical protein
MVGVDIRAQADEKSEPKRSRKEGGRGFDKYELDLPRLRRKPEFIPVRDPF